MNTSSSKEFITKPPISSLILRSVTPSLIIISIIIGALNVFLFPARIGIYGLISGLNWSYLLGFVLTLLALGIESTTRNPRKSLLWLLIILSELYLWVLPELTASGLIMPAANHDVLFFPDTSSIVAYGHITPQQLVYQSWPSAYIFAAMLKLVLPSISYVQLFNLVPILENIIVSLLLYCFLIRYLDQSYSSLAFIGVALFELFNFTESLTSISPFSLPYLLFYVCSLIFLILVKEKSLSSRSLFPIIVLFFVSLSIMHPEIALVAVFCVTAVFIPDVIRHRISVQRVVSLFLIGLVLISGWALYAGTFYLENRGLANILNLLFNVFSSLGQTATSGLVGTSGEHLLLDIVRYVILLPMAAIGVLALTKGLLKRDINYFRILCYICGIAIAAIIAGDVQTRDYPVRVFAYLLPILVFLDLSIVSMSGKKFLSYFIILLLAISAPISIIAVYGNAASESVPSSSLQASTFYDTYGTILHSNAPNTILEGQYVGSYGNKLGLLNPSSSAEILFGFGVSLPSQFTTDYVVLGQFTAAYYYFVTGNASAVNSAASNLDSSNSYNLVYSSNSMDVYFSTSAG